MKLKTQPPFFGNSTGDCTIFAIANVLHGFPNARHAIKQFSRKPTGYLVTEQNEIVRFISSNSLKLAVLHYSPGQFLNEARFRKMCPYKELAEDIFSEMPGKIMFIPLVFYIMTKHPHAISGYYALDSDVLILMDSARAGKVWIQEVHEFFESQQVYGVAGIYQEDEESGHNMPILFERSELKIYE
jgi:hypothetical protein